MRGAVDLIYLAVMALSDEALKDYRKSLLEPYHEELISALGGDEDAYPFEQLELEFKIATLDFMRWMAGSRLAGFSPAKLRVAAEGADINRGIWIRSVPRLVLLCQRVEEFLDCTDELFPHIM